MDHGTLRELAAGAALHDLDQRERQALDSHLRGCPPCRGLLDDLDGVIGELALVAPEMRPPATLRASVLEAIRDLDRAPASEVTPRSLDAARTQARRRVRPAMLAAAGIAAVLAIVTIGLGLRTMELSDAVAANGTALLAAQARLDAQAAAMAIAADPAHVTAALHAESGAAGATAVVFYRPGTNDAYLMAADLPATPTGKVYQLWNADETGVHALGTFHHDGQGPFVAPFGIDLADSAAAMVTLEPEGGARGEPGPEVVFGEL